MSAGLATLQLLKEVDPYERLNMLTERLCKGLGEAATAAGVAHQISQVGSMFTLFFNDEEVTNYSVSAKNNTERFGNYFHGMLERGFYLPCSQFEANFVSAAHTKGLIDDTIAAATEVLAKV